MAKKVFDIKVGQRRTVGFDNGVTLDGGQKSIGVILDIIGKIGAVLKEGKCSTTKTRSNTKGSSRTRKVKHSPVLAAKAERARRK